MSNPVEDVPNAVILSFDEKILFLAISFNKKILARPTLSLVLGHRRDCHRVLIPVHNLHALPDIGLHLPRHALDDHDLPHHRNGCSKDSLQREDSRRAPSMCNPSSSTRHDPHEN